MTAITSTGRAAYIPSTTVTLPGARSISAGVRSYQMSSMLSRGSSAVAGAVGGASQVGSGDLQAMLKGLLEVLQKLVELVQAMSAKGKVGPPASGGKGGCDAPPSNPPTAPIVTTTVPIITTQSVQARASVSTVGQTAEDSSFEQRVLDLVNVERAKYGLSPLRYNATLDGVSEAHNLVQVDNRTMSHLYSGDGSPEARVRAAGFYGAWGENVAVGQSSPEQVVREWMASPTHRANILNGSFSQMGVAYGRTSDGYSFWTQTFGA